MLDESQVYKTMSKKWSTTCHFHDEVTAYGTFLRGLLEARVHVVLLAVDLAVDVVEGFAPEGPPA